MRVDIERIEAMHRELHKINTTPIEDLELYRDGKRIDINQGWRNEWKYLGLNNEDFIAQYY